VNRNPGSAHEKHGVHSSYNFKTSQIGNRETLRASAATDSRRKTKRLNHERRESHEKKQQTNHQFNNTDIDLVCGGILSATDGTQMKHG
jgi:hypothetical protein